MNSTILLSIAVLAIEIGRLIHNVSRNREQLDSLNNRCRTLLSGLRELSNSVEVRDLPQAGILDETQITLKDIVEHLGPRAELNSFSAFATQRDMQTWIDVQNRKIDEICWVINFSLYVQLRKIVARQECDSEEIKNMVLHNNLPLRYHSETTASTPGPRTSTATDDPSSPNPRRALYPICNSKDGSISSANLVGLVDHVLETDDEHFKQILLQTYRDYATPEELFEVLIQRFWEVPQEMVPKKRHGIIQAILFFLPSVPPTSHLLCEIRDFATATENNLILKGIESRSHGPVPRNYGTSAESDNPDQIAVALTLMEAELRQTVRWIDYRLHDRGLPSHIDDLVSANNKMTCWLKFSILCRKEIKDRAKTIKRFVKTAETCLKLHNYNSAAVIGSVLVGWKSRPMTDIPRTMADLENNTKKSIDGLANLIHPDNNYQAYKKIVGTEKAEAHIPWLPAHLADVKDILGNCARTVEVDNTELINFERYRKLAEQVPGYQISPRLERERNVKHIAHLQHQLDTVDFNEEAEANLIRTLKEKEEKDYWTRKPQIQSLGLERSCN